MTVPWNYCGTSHLRRERELQEGRRCREKRASEKRRWIHPDDISGCRRVKIIFFFFEEGRRRDWWWLYCHPLSLLLYLFLSLNIFYLPNPPASCVLDVRADRFRMFYFTVTARSSEFRPRYRRSVPATVSNVWDLGLRKLQLRRK